MFWQRPLMRIEAPLAEAQIIETAILNIINFQTLIATKASRIKQLLGDDETALEFGARRAQEMDAAVWVRGPHILADLIPPHVFAQESCSASLFPEPIPILLYRHIKMNIRLLKHTPNVIKIVYFSSIRTTLRSGVPNAIRVAKELGDRINFIGIRIDSGDLAYLSKQARKMLDEAGFPDAKIFASNNLDEETILNLKTQGAKIDSWGVGTKLITAYDQPALGAVYKLVAIEDENGNMIDTMKITSNPEKVTTPGLKRVYRIINKETGKSEGDYVALEWENPEEEKPLKMFHPVYTFISKYVTDFEAKELHQDIFIDGELVYTSFRP